MIESPFILFVTWNDFFFRIFYNFSTRGFWNKKNVHDLQPTADMDILRNEIDKVNSNR